MERFSCPAHNMRKIHSASIFSPLQRAGSGAGGAMKKACKEAFKWDEPYFFRCHGGLVMWAAPLQIEQTRVGAIVCGQVLLWKADRLFFK